MRQRFLHTLKYCSAGVLIAATGFAQNSVPQDQQPTFAPQQQQDQTPHAWRPAPNSAGQPETAPDISPDQAQPNQPPPPPNFSSAPGNLPSPYTPLPGQQQGQAGPQGSQPYGAGGYNAPAPPPVPARLTVRPGTYITVRMGQGLSSDHAQPGDTFLGTLAEPVVVDGIVVAQRGQTVYGRVTEAQKAGKVEGTSKLGVELTGLTVVDGQQLSLQSQMINRNGPTSNGRDAGAVAGTTALGAAIGAGVGWGTGAAIGAGAGAVVGIAGVLFTRGRPTIIYPESVLTFQTKAPVEIATDHAPQAFRYVGSQQDYGRGAAGYSQRPPAGGYAGAPAQGYGAPAPGYYYGPAYYPYPYYWGPGFSVFVGPRFGYYGGFGYRGFRR
jgi:hypothetical protein